MSSFRIRPRFKQLSPLPAEALRNILSDALESSAICEGVVQPHFVLLTVPVKDRHFWSPQLSLKFEETPEGTVIRGHYGPRPNIWTLFAFSYLAIGILGVFLLMYLFSRWSLDMPLDFLWALPVLGGGALFLYVLAQFGQKIGAAQMFALHHFFEETISDKVHID
ncbi:MAG: hypothetical protein MI784_02150 [Cytophagales bacterium]|nr:hypothetical protein [Cytophagales bacterium]